MSMVNCIAADHPIVPTRAQQKDGQTDIGGSYNIDYIRSSTNDIHYVTHSELRLLGLLDEYEAVCSLWDTMQ